MNAFARKTDAYDLNAMFEAATLRTNKATIDCACVAPAAKITPPAPRAAATVRTPKHTLAMNFTPKGPAQN